MLINQQKLLSLKKEVLDDIADTSEEDLEIELKFRKNTRIITVSFFAYMMSSLAVVLFFPVFMRKNFAMPIYTQLPWTKLVI